MTDRRKFMLSGSVLLGSEALGRAIEAFAAAATPRKPAFLTEPELATLRALVDMILPATPPAASTADTQYFIDVALPACATDAAQKTFRAGLRELASQNFASAKSATQTALLKARAGKTLPSTTTPPSSRSSRTTPSPATS